MLDPKHTRSIIGLVTQEPVLFDTTVEENISLGKQDASRVEVQAAAKDANAHGFVSTMPEGYGTLVGKYLKYMCIPINITIGISQLRSAPNMIV